jgi:hypothetical protein
MKGGRDQVVLSREKQKVFTVMPLADPVSTEDQPLDLATFLFMLALHRRAIFRSMDDIRGSPIFVWRRDARTYIQLPSTSGTVFELGPTLCSPYSLVGRATFCCRARLANGTDGESGPSVAKFSWVQASRTPEPMFLDKWKDIEGFPKVQATEDITRVCKLRELVTIRPDTYPSLASK